MRITKGTALTNLVEKQILEWNIGEKVRITKEDEKKIIFPQICISREAGAGGRSVGEIVAKSLLLNCYGRAEIESAFKNIHPKWSKEVLSIYDEKARSSLNAFFNNFIKTTQPPYEEYLKTLSVIIMSIQKKEKAVIVGRGAGFFLPREKILSVRLIAPFSLRVKKIMELENLSEKDARKRTMEIDAERTRFCRTNFGVDDSSFELFDLIINTGQLSFETTASVIIEAYRKKFSIT